MLAKILKQGKSFFSDSVFIKTLPIDQDTPVFSFIVSAKVSKKATDRNKIKRRARHIVKTALKDVKKGIGAAVVFRAKVKNKDFYEIKDEMLRLFKKSGILLK